MAMMGSLAFFASASFRIADVASSPSMTGIWTSINTRSKSWRAISSRVSAPLPHLDLVAALPQRVEDQFLTGQRVLGKGIRWNNSTAAGVNCRM